MIQLQNGTSTWSNSRILQSSDEDAIDEEEGQVKEGEVIEGGESSTTKYANHIQFPRNGTSNHPKGSNPFRHKSEPWWNGPERGRRGGNDAGKLSSNSSSSGGGSSSSNSNYHTVTTKALTTTTTTSHTPSSVTSSLFRRDRSSNGIHDSSTVPKSRHSQLGIMCNQAPTRPPPARSSSWRDEQHQHQRQQQQQQQRQQQLSRPNHRQGTSGWNDRGLSYHHKERGDNITQYNKGSDDNNDRKRGHNIRREMDYDNSYDGLRDEDFGNGINARGGAPDDYDRQRRGEIYNRFDDGGTRRWDGPLLSAASYGRSESPRRNQLDSASGRLVDGHERRGSRSGEPSRHPNKESLQEFTGVWNHPRDAGGYYKSASESRFGKSESDSRFNDGRTQQYPRRNINEAAPPLERSSFQDLGQPYQQERQSRRYDDEVRSTVRRNDNGIDSCPSSLSVSQQAYTNRVVVPATMSGWNVSPHGVHSRGHTKDDSLTGTFTRRESGDQRRSHSFADDKNDCEYFGDSRNPRLFPSTERRVVKEVEETLHRSDFTTRDTRMNRQEEEPNVLVTSNGGKTMDRLLPSSYQNNDTMRGNQWMERSDHTPTTATGYGNRSQSLDASCDIQYSPKKRLLSREGWAEGSAPKRCREETSPKTVVCHSTPLPFEDGSVQEMKIQPNIEPQASDVAGKTNTAPFCTVGGDRENRNVSHNAHKAIADVTKGTSLHRTNLNPKIVAAKIEAPKNSKLGIPLRWLKPPAKPKKVIPQKPNNEGEVKLAIGKAENKTSLTAANASSHSNSEEMKCSNVASSSASNLSNRLVTDSSEGGSTGSTRGVQRKESTNRGGKVPDAIITKNHATAKEPKKETIKHGSVLSCMGPPSPQEREVESRQDKWDSDACDSSETSDCGSDEEDELSSSVEQTDTTDQKGNGSIHEKLHLSTAPKLKIHLSSAKLKSMSSALLQEAGKRDSLKLKFSLSGAKHFERTEDCVMAESPDKLEGRVKTKKKRKSKMIPLSAIQPNRTEFDVEKARIDMEEEKRKREEAKPLTAEEIRKILGDDQFADAGGRNWVRRSVRQPSKALLNSKPVRMLIDKLKMNDRDMIVLKMKKYINDPNAPSAVLDAALNAMEENTNCQALYIQNFNEGMRDQQVLHLLRILQQPSCKIWCLNIGENYNVEDDTWEKFTKGLIHTKVTHMYASEHTITTEMKDEIRATIRENRKKHDMHINPNNLDVIVQCTHCWWNPINAKSLRPFLKKNGYENLLHDKEAQGLPGSTSAVPTI